MATFSTSLYTYLYVLKFHYKKNQCMHTATSQLQFRRLWTQQLSAYKQFEAPPRRYVQISFGSSTPLCCLHKTLPDSSFQFSFTSLQITFTNLGTYFLFSMQNFWLHLLQSAPYISEAWGRIYQLNSWFKVLYTAYSMVNSCELSITHLRIACLFNCQTCW